VNDRDVGWVVDAAMDHAHVKLVAIHPSPIPAGTNCRRTRSSG
jgi:hypothetical protein